MWLGDTALTQPADLVVLAENASQIARAEENCSRTTRTPQATFLAEVGKMTAHNGVTAGLTDLGFVFQAVDVAVARAKGTVRQLLEAKLHAA
jgi:hypothetical protein